ncbi:unnamed protein product [Parascedosporium putredinis]|uniref:Uncharacterized protein n=1 Tax=Parascedosporium putredinis TaxID=1442378 RepID=A0A9P1M8G5_9PEZI|nr:unnamed protein product [Parascedosporium putredinis]CAI7989904.1 unnamed protein product [Parascedosporium putredinis]
MDKPDGHDDGVGFSPSIAESVKSSHSSVVQTLGPASFITVSTEVTGHDVLLREPRLANQSSCSDPYTAFVSILDFPSKPNNADAWRAPEAWNYNPPDSMSTTSKGLRRLDFHNDIGDDNSMALDLHGMGREIEMMAAADPTIILQRLREVWGF